MPLGTRGMASGRIWAMTSIERTAYPRFKRLVTALELMADRDRLDDLLDVTGPSRTSPFNRLKQSAGRASWSAFREQVKVLEWV